MQQQQQRPVSGYDGREQTSEEEEEPATPAPYTAPERSYHPSPYEEQKARQPERNYHASPEVYEVGECNISKFNARF